MLGDQIQHFYDNLSLKFKDFLHKLEEEKEETKQAFELIKQSALTGENLSDDEKHQVGEQLKDVLRTVGLVGIAALPGGTLFFVLVNFLKLNKYVLPSSFNKEVLKK